MGRYNRVSHPEVTPGDEKDFPLKSVFGWNAEALKEAISEREQPMAAEQAGGGPQPEGEEPSNPGYVPGGENPDWVYGNRPQESQDNQVNGAEAEPPNGEQQHKLKGQRIMVDSSLYGRESRNPGYVPGGENPTGFSIMVANNHRRW